MSDYLSADELRSKTLHGLRWTVIARPATEIVAVGTMVVLARLISPAEFGRYAVASIVASLAVIPGAGVGPAVVHHSSTSREYLQAGFALVLLSSAFLVGLTFCVASAVVVPVFGARTADLVRLTTPLCVVFAVSSLPSALLQRQLAFRRLAVIDVSSGVVGSVATIVIAVAGLGAYALVLGALAGGITTGALACIWAPPPWPRMRRAATREVMAYAVPASLAAVSWIGFSNCDYAIVGARLGVLPTGLYFRAYNLAVEYQKKVSQVIYTVGFPVLSRTEVGHDRDAARSRMVSRMTLLLFPLLVILAAVAPVFVPWFFGPAWAAAVVPTQILAIGGASVLVIDAAGAVLMAAGRPRALLAYGWAHFGTYALAVFVVAPLGLDAVAVAAAVVHTTFLFVAYGLMLRGSNERPLRSLWHDIAPAIVACGGLAVAVVPASVALSAANVGVVPYLAAVSAIAMIAYLFTLRALFPQELRGLLVLIDHVLPDRVVPALTVLRAWMWSGGRRIAGFRR